MRILALIGACGLLAACTTGPVSVPRDAVLYEVPRQPAAVPNAPARAASVPQAPRQAIAQMPQQPAPVIVAPQERDAFTSRIEQALSDEPAPMVDLPDEMPSGAPVVDIPQVTLAQPAPPVSAGSGTPLDDDRLNLNEYTLEQQRIDAAIAERQLEEARRQLVIVEPGASVPQAVDGVNIALFAKQTTHAVGERRFSRPVTAALNRGNACRRFATADEAQRFFLANGGPERDPHGLDPDGDGFACGWDPEPFRRLRM